MSPIKKTKVLVILCSAVFVIALLTYILPFNPKQRNHSNDFQQFLLVNNELFTASSEGNNTEFVVNTPTCRIPNMNPFDPILRGVLKAPAFLKCTKFIPYTYDEDQTIFVNWTAINNSHYKDVFSHCNCKPIIRPMNNETTHNSIAYLDTGPDFKTSIKVNHEYLYLRCFDKGGKVIIQNYHFIMMFKNEVEQRCKTKTEERKKNKPDVKEQMSVLIIIIDSVSRLNFMRFMPKTRRFLLDSMNATDMTGYNKVGYGTFHNMIPATTGKFYEELPWSFEDPKLFDNYKFIWDKYVDNGYRTHYAEDYPFGALFDYKKPGFKKNPSDYYGRHMFLSMYKERAVYNEENCILHKQQTDWILDPAYKFLKAFKRNPYFCFLLITRLTHDWLERTASADEVYLKFFKKAHGENILNNTMLIVTADHGMRFGPIRSKFIGLMEERLPLLFYSFPQWFTEKYPQHIRNLRINSHRLTSPFDLYETLSDFATFDGKIKQYDQHKRAQSMFTEMSINRSCNDADIPAHWCTCSGFEHARTGEPIVRDTANYLINKINSELKDVQDVCEYLKIQRITFAYRLQSLDKNASKELVTYRVALIASPGGGLFEGTISHHKREKWFKLSSEISRISQYGEEERCNVHYSLERLCYCKANRKKKRRHI